MNIESILAPERTFCCLTAGSKKKAIEEAARLIANVSDNLSAEEIYERLISREKLGTTAIGHGIAIPHCRMNDCNEIVGGLFRLEAPVDFDAFDDEPVHILFVLLVPEVEVDDHLKTLA
ncbi:MAG: PTS sugar transporter subunit IIA, partial [Pseudomonadales bacterium]